MQAGAHAAVDARAGPGLHQLQRFVDVKAQQALIDDDALAVATRSSRSIRQSGRAAITVCRFWGAWRKR